MFPFSCACAYACVRLRCVKTEHYACACPCAYACVASENQALKKRTLKFDFFILQFEYQRTFPTVQQCHFKNDSKLKIYYD